MSVVLPAPAAHASCGLVAGMHGKHKGIRAAGYLCAGSSSSKTHACNQGRPVTPMSAVSVLGRKAPEMPCMWRISTRVPQEAA